jgi:hypothetical protein
MAELNIHNVNSSPHLSGKLHVQCRASVAHSIHRSASHISPSSNKYYHRMDSPRDFGEDKALIIEDTCTCNTHSPPIKKRNIHFYVLFSVLNIIIACITVYSNANANAHSRRPKALGWDTELHDARSAIEYEERAYTGALSYDAEKREIIKVNDSKLEFFGPPSKSIDDAWQYLLHGSFDRLRITPTGYH